MVLNVTSIPTESLSVAFSISQDNRLKVVKGSGTTPAGHKLPCGTKVFVNKVNMRFADVTDTRVKDCEASHAGRFYTKPPSVTAFVDKYMSLSCAEKQKSGDWISRCHTWQYEGHSPVATVALQLDGRIDIAQLLRDMPANNLGGRPTKQQAALKRQTATADSRANILQEHPGTATFTARPGTGAKRIRKVKGNQPTGKQFLGKKVAKKFRDGCVTRC